MGVLLWRGFGVDAAMAQCLGNEEDAATKGRQMPVVGKLCQELSLLIIHRPSSILVPRSITSIPSLPLLALRFHKPPESDTRSNAIPNVEEIIAQPYFSVKVPHLRAISMLECY